MTEITPGGRLFVKPLGFNDLFKDVQVKTFSENRNLKPSAFINEARPRPMPRNPDHDLTEDEARFQSFWIKYMVIVDYFEGGVAIEKIVYNIILNYQELMTHVSRRNPWQMRDWLPWLPAPQSSWSKPYPAVHWNMEVKRSLRTWSWNKIRSC